VQSSPFLKCGSNIIHKPIAVSSNIAIMEDSSLLIKPDIIVPDKAAENEMINVITEIQRFIRVDILIPRML
jgi:hypothetical protein